MSGQSHSKGKKRAIEAELGGSNATTSGKRQRRHSDDEDFGEEESASALILLCYVDTGCAALTVCRSTILEGNPLSNWMATIQIQTLRTKSLKLLPLLRPSMKTRTCSLRRPTQQALLLLRAKQKIKTPTRSGIKA